MVRPLTSKSTRPYWHVDLKWVFGILLFFSLGTALLFFNLSKITERDRAVNISATVVANLFSKDGLDDDKGLDEFRQKAALAPGDTIAPIEQFPSITISKQDALTLPPRELRIKIFQQITEPIYDKGVKGAATQFAPDKEGQDQFAKNATLLDVFTKTTHDVTQKIFVGSLIASLVFMASVIFFSSGWGRLVSPAVVLLLVSPLGSILGLLLTHPPKDGDSPFLALPANIAQEIGNGLSQSYLAALVIGATLLLAAAVAKLVGRIRIGRKA